MPLLLLLVLLVLGIFLYIRYRNIPKANRLYLQAQELEREDRKNPYNTNKLRQALAVYRQCTKLIDRPQYTQAGDRCQQEIEKRLKFQRLLTLAKKHSKNNSFKKSLAELIKAQNIFDAKELTLEILECHKNIEQQENYEQVLKLAITTARQGEFQSAINLLIPAVQNFVRQDGEQLLSKLRLVIRARNLYQLGLVAEQEGDNQNAIAHYQQALNLLPEYIECKFRLAIIAIKNNPQQAINYLQGVKEEQAAYIRGFAQVQLGNWQQVNKEWLAINISGIKTQRSLLKKIIERDRLLKVLEIEKLIEQEKFAIAKSLSLEFIDKFSCDSIVQSNLENYIKPVLEHQSWQKKDWQKIAATTKQIWQENQDIRSLHNWAVATYYQAQVNPNKIPEFITAWLTALANIKLNPVLQDIPWLGDNLIDIEDVAEGLKQILETEIDAVKDNKIEEYLNLRDIHRRDMVMLSLSQQNNCGVRIKKLLILPNCYQKYKKYLPKIEFPAQLWGALYTDWGLAVAACYEGNTARAIKIKPKGAPLCAMHSESLGDRFAYCFISYHEGCHYLENQYWRKAIKPLKEAIEIVLTKPEWCQEIDRLCEIQRQQIGDFEEHLEFSEFWYLLISSSTSKTYYVEHQAMKIGFKVDAHKIGFQQALDELRELQNLDPSNSATANIIHILEVNLELETINILWQQGEYESAVVVAKRSHHDKVRFAVAEVCLEIVLEILQSDNLTNESLQSLQKITQWAYELCPSEASFQPVYNHLKHLGIYH